VGATLPNGTASSWQRHGALTLASLLLLAACGDGGPTGPDNSHLEILLVQGDGQAAEPGQLLPVSLGVRVQRLDDQRGEEGVTVRWDVIAGAGAIIEPPASVTDSTGMASADFTLGPSIGIYRVRASVAGMQAPPVEFGAEAILVPELILVPSDPVRTGETIRLEGNNFSSIAGQNVVTFSRVRGRVVSSTSTELQVEVPRCLPTRGVEVKVRIGALSTVGFPLHVEGGPTSLLLGRGEDRMLDASAGLACFHLPSSPGSSYLVIPLSTGTVGGAEYGYSLAGLTVDGLNPSSPGEGSGPGAEGVAHHAPIPFLGVGLEAQERWDERVRTLEGQILKTGGDSAYPGPPPLSSNSVPSAPNLGDAREFNVLNAEGTFDRVTAQVGFISTHALIYLDDQAPGGGFTEADLAELALEFDDPIHPTITGAFGIESDLDGNGRVIILLTPAVNRLTEPGSDGFVGGFFFGLDLLRNRDGSNEGEIFYALVPDPTGQAGPPISRSTVRSTVPAVLAHEFEHMVNFNLRILVGGAASQEALWLSEAMAQMAEDLVGKAFEEKGQADRAYEFRVGNWRRAWRFLLDPGEVSVLASLPPGTLAERGAGWLLLKQVSGQEGQNDLLGDLAGSVLTGVGNITEKVGRSWGSLLADWAGSLFLDDLGLPVRPELSVQGVNLRDALSQFDGSYPLAPTSLGASSFFRSGSLRSSAPQYYIITPPYSGGLAVTASGPDGRPPEPPMGLQVLVVRIQ
jgi:hypothetical protein